MTDRDLLLSVRDLCVDITSHRRTTRVVSNVELDVERGQTVGVVGESGSGKTLTSLAILGLLPRVARITHGSVTYRDRDLVHMPMSELEDIRGRRIAMIFQDAGRSLNPAYTVGEQLAEVARRHLRLGRSEARERAIEMLDRVAIRRPRERADKYPAEFSGGMAQRVMIAMALIAEPDVLIADEPTTALDVTVQAQVLALLRRLQEEMGLGVVFVTHDLGVVAEVCDVVSVMYAGEIVERSAVGTFFSSPQHPYSAALLDSVPTARHRHHAFGFIPGVVPSPNSWPSGCRFHPRCAYSQPGRCDNGPIELRATESGHLCRCVRSEELSLKGIELSGTSRPC